MRQEDDGITLSPKALLGLVLAIAGSNFVQAIYTNSVTAPESVRPDPFTGTMGRETEYRINSRIDTLDKRIDTLEKRIDAQRADINRIVDSHSN